MQFGQGQGYSDWDGGYAFVSQCYLVDLEQRSLDCWAL